MLAEEGGEGCLVTVCRGEGQRRGTVSELVVARGSLLEMQPLVRG